MYQFRVQCSPVVCNKIHETSRGRFLRLPDTTKEREIIEHETRRLWQSPKCTGAANGKHITIIHSFGILTNYCNVFTTRLCLDLDKDTIITQCYIICFVNSLMNHIHQKDTSTCKQKVEVLQKGNGDKKLLECQFYKVCQRIIHEKLLSMPNISEMHLPIIFGDLARVLGNGK